MPAAGSARETSQALSHHPEVFWEQRGETPVKGGSLSGISEVLQAVMPGSSICASILSGPFFQRYTRDVTV